MSLAAEDSASPATLSEGRRTPPTVGSRGRGGEGVEEGRDGRRVRRGVGGRDRKPVRTENLMYRRLTVSVCLSLLFFSWFQVKIQDGQDEWGWGIVVKVMKQPPPPPATTLLLLAQPPSSLYILDVLLKVPVAEKGEEVDGEGERRRGRKQRALRPCGEGEEGELAVVSMWGGGGSRTLWWHKKPKRKTHLCLYEGWI